jgi:CheY-like chemotaxis protein
MANILVVDDEKNIRSHLETYLHGLGHRVAVAADGAQALQRAGAEPFDVVLSDVRMAGMDGGALRELRRRRPEAVVVLMTATPRFLARRGDARGRVPLPREAILPRGRPR